MPDYRLLAVFIGVFILGGCAVSTKDTIAVTQPVSAVEGVVDNLLGKEKEIPDVDTSGLPRHLAIIPFANVTDEPDAPEVMRRTLQNHLATKNYRVNHWRETDLKLTDWQDLDQASSASLTEALGVTGLIRGSITSYDFLHVGVYAQIKLGVDLRLENAAGEVLWSDQLDVTTRAGGVSTTPWGLLLNAALATMHLSEENLLAAADELGREVAAVFPEPEGYQFGSGPNVDSVLHDGADKTLRYGDTLTIGVKGDPGMRAIAAIDGVGSLELSETEPGEYIVEQPVSANWNATNKQVVGVLVDATGQQTRWVSPVGLVNIDNQAPAALAKVNLTAHSDNAYLAWQAPSDSDLATYRVYSLSGGVRELVGEVEQTEVTLPQAGLFGTVRFEVTAVDRAGNESSGTTASARAYPVPGAVAAEIAASRLGGIVNDGGLILTAANSPYTLADPLVIESGGELFVEPGVVISAAPGSSIHIRGKAWFWGSQRAIQFQPSQDAAVDRYLILDSEDHISLEGVTFERAAIAMDIRSGSAEVKGAVFNNTEHSALHISGSASPRFEACTVAGSNTSGVVIENHAKPVFSGCTFSGNEPFHIQSTSIYEVNAEGNTWQPAASSTTILGQVRY